MFPAEHLIVALIPTCMIIIGINRELPEPSVIGAVFLGSQFPDLIDKPLAFQFGAIPTGRVFIHSLPIALPFLIAVVMFGQRTNRLPLALVFSFALLTHLITDTHHLLIAPNPSLSPDLFWPLVKPVPRPSVPHWAGPDKIIIHLWTVWSILVLLWAGWWIKTDNLERKLEYP